MHAEHLGYKHKYQISPPDTKEAHLTFLPSNMFELKLMEFFYLESFFIFMASFQEHHIYEKRITHINRTGESKQDNLNEQYRPITLRLY